MRREQPRARSSFRRALLIVLGFAACEPLELQLFPERGAGLGSLDEPDASQPAAVPDAAPDAAPVAPCSPRCVACMANAACDEDESCHPFTGQCVTPCGPGLPQCPDDDVCNETLGVCVSCTADDQCTSGDLEICDTLQGVCVECMNDSQCTDDPEERPRCLTALGVCGCERDADCASGVCDEDDAECEDDDDS